MRKLLLATLVVLGPTMAFADETVSGSWLADKLGHGVVIQMDILADGHWRSQTVQNDKVVADLAGTYEQTKSGPMKGDIVFTPLQSQTDPSHGAAKIERDVYELKQNGNVLTLTSGKDVMTFKQQAQ